MNNKKMNNITVYSGEDIISSRKAFLDQIQSLKDKDYEVVRLAGKDATEESIELVSSPTSLFGQERCLAIEGLLSVPKSKEKDKIFNRIVALLDCYIVDWESKEFSKAEQLKFPNFTFKNFKLPSSVFTFLDKLSPNKPKENISAFHQTISEVDPAFVFIMLIRQIRMLILASENELASLPSWQSGKYIHQAKLFTKEKLLEVYKIFLEIDFKQKTSQTPFSLAHELDLLLAEF